MREVKKPFCDIPSCEYNGPRFHCTSRRKYWGRKNYRRGYGFIRIYRFKVKGYFYCAGCAQVIRDYESLPLLPMPQMEVKTRRVRLRRSYAKEIKRTSITM
jgi:hypothetical protein